MSARIHRLIDTQVAGRPDGPAVRDALGHKVTFGGYAGASLEAADLLKRGSVKAGDRVMIVAENCLATAVTILAASRLGACAVPVNARMAEAEIARIVSHCEPSVTIFTSEASREAAAHAARAGAAEVRTSFGTVAISTDRSTGGATDEDVAAILYTTGTTGDPKGVMLTHRNLVFAGAASRDLRGMRADDCVYGALPLTHVFGLASMLMASAAAGAEVVLETRFAPDKLLEALRAGVSVLPAVPQMHALLMKHTAELGMERLEGGRLRYVSSGAAPLDPAWKRKAEAFYGLPLQNGYGMTESTAGVCGTRNPIGTTDVSVGPPLPGLEIDIAAPNDDGVGEILTRGPHVMKGYFRNPDATLAALDAAGWLRTGDLGFIDEGGRLHVVGRAKELIIRSGFNVYPPEVEAALNDHAAVVQSAVIGRARAGNEDVLAFVQLTSPGAADEATLRDFVSGRLSSYKRPSAIIMVDTLPAAATGKILKHKLLDAFADRLAALEKE